MDLTVDGKRVRATTGGAPLDPGRPLIVFVHGAGMDRTIWALNWSAPGKFLNSGVVTILLLTTKSAWAVWPVLAVLFGIKIYSWLRLHRLPRPPDAPEQRVAADGGAAVPNFGIAGERPPSRGRGSRGRPAFLRKRIDSD